MSDVEGNPGLLPEYDVETIPHVPAWLADQAWLIHDALDIGETSRYQAEHGLTSNKELDDLVQSMQPYITFFVELPHDRVSPDARGEYLLNMVRSKIEGYPLAEYLASHCMDISLAMGKLDSSTAEAIHILEKAGVYVTAWVVTHDTEGYWTNKANIAATVRRTWEIMAWAQENKLDIKSFGYDLEMPLEVVRAAANFPFQVGRFVRERFWKYVQATRRERRLHGDPIGNFESYLGELAAAGYETEVYVFPRPLQGLLGGMDTDQATRKVEMLYSSELTSLPLRWRRIGALAALGIVADPMCGEPGRKLKKHESGRHLSEEQLTRDMTTVLLNGRQADVDPMYVFALNGPEVPLFTRRALQRAQAAQLSSILPPTQRV